MTTGITANQHEPGVISVFSRSVTLIDAQIKALPTTPVVIVPPTEVIDYEGVPTQLQIPLYSVVRMDVLTAPYTNVDAECQTFINLGSDNSFTFSPPQTGVDLFTQSGFTVFYPARALTGASSGDPVAPATNNLTDSLLDNAIVLVCLNGGDGNFTGGNAANRLKVTVLYAVIEV